MLDLARAADVAFHGLRHDRPRDRGRLRALTRGDLRAGRKVGYHARNE